jgi:hypothetical protein
MGSLPMQNSASEGLCKHALAIYEAASVRFVELDTANVLEVQYHLQSMVSYFPKATLRRVSNSIRNTVYVFGSAVAVVIFAISIALQAHTSFE